MKAGIYARISQDTEGQGLGVARQEQACRAKAKALGWEVADTYVDNDLSASKAVQRPQYDRLMSDLAAGTINALVVYDLDRLTRKPAELETFIDLADKHGIRLANVSGDVDLTTGPGRLFARIKGAVARAESDRLAERVLAQQRQYAESGRKHQGYARVFGYDRAFNVIETEAAVVRDVFARKAAGESLTSIAHRLNTAGTKTVTGGTWDASAISKMIKRHDYIAEITIKGEVVGDAAFDAIVERAVWIKANEEAEKSNNRGKGARKSLLAGFLVCGNCLTKMKQGGAKGSPRYNCPSPVAVPSACGSCSIVGPKTDTAVFNAAWAQEQQEGNKVTDKPKRDYKGEQDAITAEIEQVHDMRKSGALALVDAVPMLGDLRAKLTKVQREEAADTTVDFGTLQIIEDWENWSLSEQRMWLDQWVSYVMVSKAETVGLKGYRPDRLEIHFTDGTVRRLSKAGHVTVW